MKKDFWEYLDNKRCSQKSFYVGGIDVSRQWTDGMLVWLNYCFFGNVVAFGEGDVETLLLSL